MTAVTTAVTPARIDPIAAARALLARLDIRAPHEIKVALIAYDCGALVLPRTSASADARVVRSGSRAIIAIAPEAMGTPRGRFSIAHELGHYLMHPDCDAIARIHGAPRTSGREYLAEREANLFGSELLVPCALAEPLCAHETPSLDAVGAFARTFDVSLTVAAKKWAPLARTPCAVVESKGDTITRVLRSGAFRGIAFGRRKLGEGTLALEMARVGGAGGKRVHDEAACRWGSALSDADVIEECVPLGDGSPGGGVLTWLWHA